MQVGRVSERRAEVKSTFVSNFHFIVAAIRKQNDKNTICVMKMNAMTMPFVW